jgi:hypothetical protein
LFDENFAHFPQYTPNFHDAQSQLPPHFGNPEIHRGFTPIQSPHYHSDLYTSAILGRHTVSTVDHAVPYGVPHHVPFHITKAFGVPVHVAVPVDIPRGVHIPVPHPVPVHVDRPVPVGVPRPVPYHVEQKIPVQITQTVGVPVPHPVGVNIPEPQPFPITANQYSFAFPQFNTPLGSNFEDFGGGSPAPYSNEFSPLTQSAEARIK